MKPLDRFHRILCCGLVAAATALAAPAPGAAPRGMS